MAYAIIFSSENPLIRTYREYDHIFYGLALEVLLTRFRFCNLVQLADYPITERVIQSSYY